MIDFPASPTDGQVFSATNGVVYKWSATYSSWLAQNAAPPLGGTGDFFAATNSPFTMATTETVVVPATVITGNSGLWYSNSTGRYIPPAGRYLIFATAVGGGPTGAVVNELRLRKNGTMVERSVETPAATAYYNTNKIAAIVDANGSDYFDLTLWANNSSNQCSNLYFGASPLTGIQGPTGPAGVTQTVFFETGAVATGTTVIPFDDTIPQITEGNEYMTLAITPKSASSRLVIEVVAVLASNAATGNTINVALFQDSTANALAVASSPNGGAPPVTISFRHLMTSGTTSSTTFRVRAGTNIAGTTTFNGNGGSSARAFGGVAASSIVIQEVT